MGFKDFFKPKWKHSDPNVRRNAIETIDDASILKKIVLFDNDDSIKKAAIYRISDESVLKEIAFHENIEVPIQVEVIEKITDESILKEIALMENIDVSIRFAAIEKIADESILKEIAFLENIDVSSRINPTIRIEVILEDERLSIEELISIAQNDNDVIVRRHAINKIASVLYNCVNWDSGWMDGEGHSIRAKMENIKNDETCLKYIESIDVGLEIITDSDDSQLDNSHLQQYAERYIEKYNHPYINKLSEKMLFFIACSMENGIGLKTAEKFVKCFKEQKYIDTLKTLDKSILENISNSPNHRQYTNRYQSWDGWESETCTVTIKHLKGEIRKFL